MSSSVPIPRPTDEELVVFLKGGTSRYNAIRQWQSRLRELGITTNFFDGYMEDIADWFDDQARRRTNQPYVPHADRPSRGFATQEPPEER